MSGGIEGQRRVVSNVRRTRESIIRAVRASVTRTVVAVERGAKQAVDANGSNVDGVLRASITSSVRSSGDGAIVTGEVTVGAFYGRWVEYGRKGLKSNYPGIRDGLSAEAAWPPVDAIDAWVRKKIGVKGPRVVLKSRFYQRYPQQRAARAAKIKAAAIDKEAARIAFLVGRKIAMKGIPPRPFLGPVARREVRAFNRRTSQLVSIALAALK